MPAIMPDTDCSAYVLCRATHSATASDRTPRSCPDIVIPRDLGLGPVSATRRSLKRDERTDSRRESLLTIVPPKAVSQRPDVTLLSRLPATARPDVYSFARTKPVDLTQYLRSLDFEFDLRTSNGLLTFTAWCGALGSHAWSVRSLTLRHWTTWWGFGNNAWTSAEDKTHFSRSTSGELEISRALPTPAQETCNCSIAQLLAQFDLSFDIKRYCVITSMKQFSECMKEEGQVAERPTLVNAAQTFAWLTQQQSSRLAKYHGLAGGLCVTCDMPSLYLCGHLSTREGENGSEIVFDARAGSKKERV